jgi:Zn-dependent M28 family amino/carboxypeptidase
MNNASGVAGLIELARLLKDVDLTQRVKLVAYTDEESPFLYALHR